MDYIIWTKDGYSDTWSRKDAGDKGAAKRLILEELKEGRQPVLTVEVPFDLQLNVGDPGGEVKKPASRTSKSFPKNAEEEAKLEADQDQAEPDQAPGG